MKKIRNADFIVTLPDEVAGLELGSNDSVTLRVYTVNADNYYQFDYAGGLVPEEQKVDASCMVTMESGVVQLLVTAHIADSTMPDGFLDIAEEVPTDYYWVKSQNESAQEQINQLRRDLAEETEIREAADDALEERMDDLEDEVDTISVEITEISGTVAENTSMISDINLQLDNFNDWQERQDSAIEEISGKVGTNSTAIATERTARENADISLGASITAETYQRQQADTALSGAITQEAAQRYAAIQALEETHNEDIEYLTQNKLDVATFEDYTGSTSTDIADVKTKEGIISGQVQSNLVQIQTLEIKKMDVSGMTDYATKTYTDTGLATKQGVLTAGSGITIDANNVIACTVEFDPTILDDYATKQYVDDAVDAIDLSDYQPVSAMTDYATTGQVDTLATEVAGKLDATAYTPFDPSVLADYATLDYADAISGVTEEIADTLDQATEVTARSLNELRNTKLDASAYTPFDPSVLADYATVQYVDDAIDDIDLSDYQPISGMSEYQEALVSGGNIKTLNSQSIVGSGDVVTMVGFNVTENNGTYTADITPLQITTAMNNGAVVMGGIMMGDPLDGGESVALHLKALSMSDGYIFSGLYNDEILLVTIGNNSVTVDTIALGGDTSDFYTKAEIDNAEQATSAALNDLNLRLIEVSGNTFDDSVLADYQPVSGMSSYATITYVDTQIGNINTILNNING